MKKLIKQLLGCVRRADDDFLLINDGDSIAVGVSGGKDSLALLYFLNLYRRFSKKEYTLHAITVDTGNRPFDFERIVRFCEQLNVPYTVTETNIAKTVFETREEKNPCALCANLRRGTLNNTALKLGCNKTALGHHSDDVAETFLMSLLYEGRLNVFTPSTVLSRTGLTVIRPLVYAAEDDISRFANCLPLPVVESPCPVNGKTSRAKTGELIKTLEQTFPDAGKRISAAVANTDEYHLWDTVTK